MFQACYWGDAANAAYLLSEGADANQPGERGDTALHTAGFMGRGDITELLLARRLIAEGFDVNAPHSSDGRTETPLDMAWAMQEKSVSPEDYGPVIALLREHGGEAREELEADDRR